MWSPNLSLDVDSISELPFLVIITEKLQKSPILGAPRLIIILL